MGSPPARFRRLQYAVSTSSRNNKGSILLKHYFPSGSDSHAEMENLIDPFDRSGRQRKRASRRTSLWMDANASTTASTSSSLHNGGRQELNKDDHALSGSSGSGSSNGGGSNSQHNLSAVSTVTNASRRRRTIDNSQPTQHFSAEDKRPLEGTVCYVTVYSDRSNFSLAVCRRLEELGAKATTRFTTNVTHVIFKEGLQSLVDKARARRLPILSVQWIEACANNRRRMPEEDYSMEERNPDGTPKMIGMIRRPKSMNLKEYRSPKRRKPPRPPQMPNDLSQSMAFLQDDSDSDLDGPSVPVYCEPVIEDPVEQAERRYQLEQRRKQLRDMPDEEEEIVPEDHPDAEYLTPLREVLRRRFIAEGKESPFLDSLNPGKPPTCRKRPLSGSDSPASSNESSRSDGDQSNPAPDISVYIPNPRASQDTETPNNRTGDDSLVVPDSCPGSTGNLHLDLGRQNRRDSVELDVVPDSTLPNRQLGINRRTDRDIRLGGLRRIVLESEATRQQLDFSNPNSGMARRSDSPDCIPNSQESRVESRNDTQDWQVADTERPRAVMPGFTPLMDSQLSDKRSTLEKHRERARVNARNFLKDQLYKKDGTRRMNNLAGPTRGTKRKLLSQNNNPAIAINNESTDNAVNDDLNASTPRARRIENMFQSFGVSKTQHGAVPTKDSDVLFKKRRLETDASEPASGLGTSGSGNSRDLLTTREIVSNRLQKGSEKRPTAGRQSGRFSPRSSSSSSDGSRCSRSMIDEMPIISEMAENPDQGDTTGGATGLDSVELSVMPQRQEADVSDNSFDSSSVDSNDEPDNEENSTRKLVSGSAYNCDSVDDSTRSPDRNNSTTRPGIDVRPGDGPERVSGLERSAGRNGNRLGLPEVSNSLTLHDASSRPSATPETLRRGASKGAGKTRRTAETASGGAGKTATSKTTTAVETKKLPRRSARFTQPKTTEERTGLDKENVPTSPEDQPGPSSKARGRSSRNGVTVTAGARKSTQRARSANKNGRSPANGKLGEVRGGRIQKPRRHGGLALTSLHRGEREIVNAVVKKLRTFERLQPTVNSQTTHLVFGRQRRTVNALRALVMGCWTLSLDWVLSSLEAGGWLEEKDYLDNPVLEGVQAYVRRPEKYRQLFEDCGLFYVSPTTAPPARELTSLLVLCGAKITKSIRRAAIAIGSDIRYPEMLPKTVSEQWVLDSITAADLLCQDDYRIA